jgi:phytoene dehydrogenase-like protein
VSVHDVIVIGAGPNGLTAASLLAKRGRKVLVLERRNVVGGLAAREEFHPGYHGDGVLTDTTGLSRSVVEQLGLTSHGLSWRTEAPSVWGIDDEGQSICLQEDDRSSGLTGEDATRLADFRRFLQKVRPVLTAFREDDPIDLIHAEDASRWGLARRALQVRRLGRADMMELLRIPPMAAADWLD